MKTPLDLDAIRRRINHPLNALMELGEAARGDRERNVADFGGIFAIVAVSLLYERIVNKPVKIL